MQQGESSLRCKARPWLRKTANRIKKYVVIHQVVDSHTCLHPCKTKYSFFFFLEAGSYSIVLATLSEDRGFRSST